MSELMSCPKPPVIGPGTCPPQGCPPPTRIECIAVDKVYDNCFQFEEKTKEFLVPFFDLTVGGLVPCQMTPGATVLCAELSRVDVGDGFYTISIMVTVPMTLTNPNDPTAVENTSLSFTKTVTLHCPPEAMVDCSDTNLVSCICVVIDAKDTEATVNCDVQICLIIKCLLTVQLLVPSYGFCTPAPCVTLPSICPSAPPGGNY